MSLRLNLLKSPGGIPLANDSYLFNATGGTLGRADTNSWVLPDPEKFLSSCHCEIIYESGAYFLIDRSTNGTFLNGEIEPIGRGNREKINDKDIVELGDYKFSASLESAGAAFDSFAKDDLFSDPFAEPFYKSENNAFSNQSETSPEVDYFSTPMTHNASPFAGDSSDPFASWETEPKFSPPTQSFGSLADFEQDPFSGFSGNLPDTNNQVLNEFIGSSTTSDQASMAYGSLDLSASLDQSIKFPDIQRERVIPDDWDDDLLGVSNPVPTSTPKAIVDSPENVRQQIKAPEPLSSVVKPSIPARLPLAERLAALERAEANSAEKPYGQPAQPVPQAINIDRTRNQESVAKVTARDAYSSKFVDGLGLDKSRLTPEDVDNIEYLGGQLLREITDGMLGVLRSRASIKNEFRMNVTTIQPVENNPLKFSVNAEDALENLFLKKSKAFKNPIESFNEGFQEIAEHQVAMIAGIRAGFDSMLSRFSPDVLETIFAKQAKNSLLPGLGKSKYWNHYQEYAKNITDNTDQSFQQIFGSEFVSAYEDQLRKLVNARKQGNRYET